MTGNLKLSTGRKVSKSSVASSVASALHSSVASALHPPLHPSPLKGGTGRGAATSAAVLPVALQRSDATQRNADGVGNGGDESKVIHRLMFPWPPADLSPNARHGHWSSLARAKKRYRNACAMQARVQGAARVEVERLAVALEFVPPDRRARDLDNCIASLKAGLDGLADVLGVDDSRWTLQARMGAGPGGFVRVEVAACLQAS